MADDLPKGRWRRAAKVGRLAGGQTARGYATKAANLTRDEEARRDAAARRQMQAAEQIFEVLGQMKGAAMKVGQVASFMDTGAFPPEFQERIQAKLAELRDAAPRVSFKDMRKVIEHDLGERLADVFTEFDEEAVAAASIGQVYRARLADGREVAVKVQYPGVAQAVRSDLQNLGLIMRVAKRMAPGMDAKAMTREIRERLTDELDYEHEAQQHRAFARSWRGHPFIYVPPVVTELCTEHVLVSEWVEGTGFEDVKAGDAATRDRFGEIVFRFFFGSLYRNGHFSGDPHPGNYRLMEDGRVAFIDFGMTKRVDRADLEAEVGALRLPDGRRRRGRAPPARRDGLLRPRRRGGHARGGLRALPGRDALVRGGPRADRRPRAGQPGADRLRRPALAPLAAHAPGDDAPAGDAGAAHGGAHARRARPARRDGELAPDRARVAVRRPALDRAGGARAPLPRARRGVITRKATAVLREADPVMARLVEEHTAAVRRDLKRERPGDAYGTLVRAIVGQQLSTRAAATIFGRVRDLFGGHTPTPGQLLRAEPDALLAAGLSNAKVAYLRDLAQHVEDGTLALELLPDLPDDEVVAQLTAVRGVGRWTADMFLMFHLRRPDILAVGDLGIRRAVEVQYGLRKLPDAKRVERIAKPWRPYRTLACLYLWSSLENTPG